MNSSGFQGKQRKSKTTTNPMAAPASLPWSVDFNPSLVPNRGDREQLTGISKMFKAARWRSEKNKIKVVFRLQFQATQVPVLGSETVMVSLVPLDVGRPTVRSEKVAVMDGTCNWSNPIYETVSLACDPKSGKINEKFYQFLVSAQGSSKPGLLGEVTVNLADYFEVFKASSVALPLKAGAILHVTIQRMKGEVAGRGAEEDGDGTARQQCRTLRSQISKCDNKKGLKALIGRNDMSLVKDGSYINREPRVDFPSSRNLPTRADSNGKLQKSQSSGALSGATSGSSSEVHKTRENRVNNGSFLSPLRDVLRERLQFSDDSLEKLSSDVVLLTRKVEESGLELQSLRKQIVKESRQRQDLSREISSMKEERDALRRECEELKPSQKRNNVVDKDLAESQLEEVKQELDHERNLNSSLRLQLQKTQEANSELLLAVRDLDDLLEKKNRETPCCMKDEKELEMQLEQLASDYEILKQENHDISSKLEQHEQLRIHHECSEHSAIIHDLEAHVESLEKELQTQTQAKVEQEKKAIRAEEALRKAKWKFGSTIERLHEQLKRLSSQASSAFYGNEKAVKHALKEASELRSQNSHLEELLKKTMEDLASVQSQCRVNLQQLLSLLDSKSKEADKLQSELKDRNEELERYKRMQSQKTQIEKLETEKFLASEEREKLVYTANEMMLHDRNLEGELLKKEILPLRPENSGLRNVRGGEEAVIRLLNSEEDKHCHESSRCANANKCQSDVDCLQQSRMEVKAQINNANPRDQEKATRFSRTNSEEKEHIVSCTFDDHKVSEIISELAVLRKQNESTEADLKEMQERYSEISLKFAEVEGERQQLMMTIRALKNALKN
ncbi:ATP-dependent RNA helicase [Musa troglodytarum]|uniref:ATP-dependent RNA helicase n=1 Tax=Musa troglodytarum TaxID=320322 RepID=A0A9E7ES31_9LILI|nr:ATP-dependent RNA helicase [Musa troglodytarum]